jgi:hypothetical protein
MAQSHVLSALIDKRSELMGLVEVKRKELEQLNQGLVSIDGTIKLFDPDFHLASIKAKRPTTPNRFFSTGEAQRIVFDVLRGTDGVITTEIVKSVMRNKGLNDSLFYDVNNAIDKTLRYMEKKGQLSHEKVNGVNIWRVV